MKRMAIIILTITLVLLNTLQLAYTETFKWVDERGTVHFTDDVSKIPEKYQPPATKNQEEGATKEKDDLKKQVGDKHDTPRTTKSGADEPSTIKQLTYEGKVIKNGMKWRDINSMGLNIGWSKDRQDMKVGAIEDRKNNKLYLLWFKNPKREPRDDLVLVNWELTLIQVISDWK